MIKIKYSCPESVAEMSETNCGKFCVSCQQEVHDFTANSIEEILQIKVENPTIKCGMFTPQQAVIDSRTAVQNVFRMAFAAIFILGFNTTILFGQSAEPVLSDSVKVEMTTGSKIIIAGWVTDHTGLALKGQVKFAIDGEDVIVETNEEGVFEFELPNELLGQSITLQFYSEGFGYKYITTGILQAKCYRHHVTLGLKKYDSQRNRVLSGFF